MHVCLIYPEVYDLARFRERRREFPPFGVLYLGSVLEAAGHAVAIHKIGPGGSVQNLSNYDAVGFSIASSATYNVLKSLRQTSTFKPGALIMVGGVHANFFPEMTLADFDADVVCFDEGEEAILEILTHSVDRDFSSILGVCYRSSTGVIRTPSRVKDKDIDWLPLPARHLLPKEDVLMADRLATTDLRMAHVMFSRGCPFPCRFCAVSQRKMQYRSGASARAELVHLKEKYGIDGFSIVDDNFVVNKKKVHEISSTIADLNLSWSALSRTDTVDADLLKSMAGSGCIEIKYGLESGSARMLNAMDKRISVDEAVDNIRMTHALGIGVKLFLIHGYPGEDEASTMETLHVLERIKPFVDRVSLFRFVPLPGTYAYNHFQELGIRGTHQDSDWDGDWSRFHIHSNGRRWWGGDRAYHELNRSFEILNGFVVDHWPDRHGQPSTTDHIQLPSLPGQDTKGQIAC